MGGAEKNMFEIIKNTNFKYQHVIISLTNEDFYFEKLNNLKIKILRVNLRKNLLIPIKIFKILFLINKINPDIIHTWLYLSDLIGGLCGSLLGFKNIIWSIRHDINEKSKFEERLIVKILGFLSSKIPKAIIGCSHIVAENHIKYGYKRKKIHIINNGVDIFRFRPDPLIRKKLISDHEIKKEEIILGMVARYSKIKNHQLLFKALSILKEKNIKFKCIIIGDKVSRKNHDLLELIDLYGISRNIIINENNQKIEDIFALIDINILTSQSECFPNVLIEAMASGTPCICTNVGEAKFILRDAGWILNDFKPITLVNQILDILKNDKYKSKNFKKNCRQIIIKNYSLEKMIFEYNLFYSKLS